MRVCSPPLSSKQQLFRESRVAGCSFGNVRVETLVGIGNEPVLPLTKIRLKTRNSGLFSLVIVSLASFCLLHVLWEPLSTFKYAQREKPDPLFVPKCREKL